MQRIIAVFLATIVLSGCSGMSIQPINPDMRNYFTAGNSPNGYVVYEPTLYVSVVDGPNGTCVISKSFVLPDYSRPYRLSSSRGFGKSGVEFSIADGWMLSNAKDNSDNSAVLAALSKATGMGFVADKCEKGIYKLDKKADGKFVKAAEMPNGTTEAAKPAAPQPAPTTDHSTDGQ